MALELLRGCNDDCDGVLLLHRPQGRAGVALLHRLAPERAFSAALIRDRGEARGGRASRETLELVGAELGVSDKRRPLFG